MPGAMSGRDLADLLLRERPDLKVLFGSGYSREHTGVGQDEHSSECYLSKPYDPKTLAHIVGTILSKSERDKII